MNPNGRTCPVYAEYEVAPGETRTFGELLAANVGRPWRKIQPKAFRLGLRRAGRAAGEDLPSLAIHYVGFPGAVIAPTRDRVEAWLESLLRQERERLYRLLVRTRQNLVSQCDLTFPPESVSEKLRSSPEVKELYRSVEEARAWLAENGEHEHPPRRRGTAR